MISMCTPSIEIRIHGRIKREYESIFTPGALRFLALLANEFEDRRQMLLEQRKARQERFDAGILPDFLPETEHIRRGDWKVAPCPPALADRRVEITGPVDRKMVINGLNSGANTYMADFEDSSAPTWEAMVDGQVNLRDAVRRTITFVNPANGKEYKLNDHTSVLLVRPRGWHLNEEHVTVGGRPMSASLFDFGLFMFHNAYNLLAQGAGPYFYLPKMEHHLEARLWNDVFVFAQDHLGIPVGTVRATALLETFPAAFQMDEILYELRDHSSGLNCGRWDYLFSFIKTMRNHPEFVTPDRGALTMTTPFMDAYVRLLIRTCHKRGAHAMGGMAAQIPVKSNEEMNRQAFEGVRNDKLREVRAGHDGTWVAHPGLVSVAREVFDQHMPEPNQIATARGDQSEIPAAQLMALPERRDVTDAGVRENVRVLIQYVEGWVRGIGCIPLNHKMEDAATAEISRAQVWQWMRHGVNTMEGTPVTADLVVRIVQEEMRSIQASLPAERHDAVRLAATLSQRMLLSSELHDFLTSYCYSQIVAPETGNARL